MKKMSWKKVARWGVLHENTYRADRYTIAMLETICGTYVGVSACNPVDIFDKATGRRIAYERALKKFYLQNTRILQENAIRDFAHTPCLNCGGEGSWCADCAGTGYVS